jgi:hypothetical protein
MPFDHTREQHNKKRSWLNLNGRRVFLELKRGLLKASKWIYKMLTKA